METKTLTNHNGVKLNEVWHRLDGVCRRLWDEDSPAAIGLQTVIEEFKGEVHRVEQLILSYLKMLNEQRGAISKEFESIYSEKIRSLELQLTHSNERVSALDDNLLKKESKVKDLLKELAVMEAENVEFHDKYLKASSDNDELRAKKMETFYQDLIKKGAELETVWESRHKAMEAEFKQRADAQQKKYEDQLSEVKARTGALETQHDKRVRELEQTHERTIQEMSTWESKKLQEQESLLKRDEELTLRSQELAQEYKKKQLELQTLKETMQREISEVIRQYQAKLRNEQAAG